MYACGYLCKYVCMCVHISIIHAGLSIKKNDIGVWWLLENYNSAHLPYVNTKVPRGVYQVCTRIWNKYLTKSIT